MSAVLTRSRVSSEQLDLLLSFMEDHPDFAAGKQSIYSRFSSCKLWRLLAERLNAVAADSGGARKSPDKWCRVRPTDKCISALTVQTNWLFQNHIIICSFMQYWADIKYKARKKSAAGGALGDLSSAEERLQSIFNSGGRDLSGGRHGSHSDEERKHTPLEDDMRSEGSAAGGDGARLNAEELIAEAALRTALAAEKQADAVAQAVELLRDLVALLRERVPAPPPAHPAHPAPPPPPAALVEHALAPLQHHVHHRL